MVVFLSCEQRWRFSLEGCVGFCLFPFCELFSFLMKYMCAWLHFCISAIFRDCITEEFFFFFQAYSNVRSNCSSCQILLLLSLTFELKIGSMIEDESDGAFLFFQ